MRGLPKSSVMGLPASSKNTRGTETCSGTRLGCSSRFLSRSLPLVPKIEVSAPAPLPARYRPSKVMADETRMAAHNDVDNFLFIINLINY